jgi:hypothetical protein
MKKIGLSIIQVNEKLGKEAMKRINRSKINR